MRRIHLKPAILSHARLSDHVRTPWSLVIGFLWGFAEATLFFIVPDVYLGFVALFNLRRGLQVMLAGLLGAILGGSVMYLLAMNDPAGTRLLLARVPLIDAALIATVADEMHAHGLVAMLTGPIRGTPYKIYATQAGVQSIPLLSLLLMTIPARLGRFFPVVLAFGAIGKRFKAFCETHTRIVVGSYILLWGLIYFVFISYFGFH
jgi:membrane protein YqaA with SNARE-associated domain